MNKSYYLICLFTILLTISCKQKETTKTKKSLVETVRTPEEDQILLEHKLAFAKKKYDSLFAIQGRSDIDEENRDSTRRRMFQMLNEMDTIVQRFVKENPNSLISVERLNGYKFKWGKEITEELYALLGPNVKNSENGLLIQRYLTFYKKPKVNDPYTDFELENVNGDKIKLSNNVKSYTLLEFWASYCRGCRKEHPNLIKVYEEFKEEFTVIGISADDDKAVWKKAVDKDELPWINLLLPEGRESVVNQQYGIHKLATNFLIGPNGKILFIDINPEQLKTFLEKELTQAK